MHQRATGLETPPQAPNLAASGLPEGLLAAIGFEPFGVVALRVDVVERLAARLRALARQGPFELGPELLALTGLEPAELATVVEALGYARDAGGRLCPTPCAAFPEHRPPGRRALPTHPRSLRCAGFA